MVAFETETATETEIETEMEIETEIETELDIETETQIENKIETIERVTGREVFDSSGKPTVEVDVKVRDLKTAQLKVSCCRRLRSLPSRAVCAPFAAGWGRRLGVHSACVCGGKHASVLSRWIAPGRWWAGARQ